MAGYSTAESPQMITYLVLIIAIIALIVLGAWPKQYRLIHLFCLMTLLCLGFTFLEPMAFLSLLFWVILLVIAIKGVRKGSYLDRPFQIQFIHILGLITLVGVGCAFSELMPVLRVFVWLILLVIAIKGVKLD